MNLPAVRSVMVRGHKRWEMYGGLCWICGTTATANDHVKPLARGGLHIPSNIRPICHSCNSRKSATWPFPTDPYWAFIALYRDAA